MKEVNQTTWEVSASAEIKQAMAALERAREHLHELPQMAIVDLGSAISLLGSAVVSAINVSEKP